MLVRPGVEFKPIECDTLPTDADLSEETTDLCVEAAPVHAEIEGCIAESHEPR